MFLAGGIFLFLEHCQGWGVGVGGRAVSNPGSRSLVTSSLGVKTGQLLILSLSPEATEQDRILRS